MTLALGFPNRFSNASLSGVGWTTGLPLSYLGTRQLSQVARAISTVASFYASFSSATEAGMIGLAGHNLSTAGDWRVRGFSSDPRPTYEANFTQGQLPSGWTCTRSGATATYFGSDGLLKTAAADTARITHDPATRECLGLLVEASAVNALTYARDGTNAAWSKTGMSAPTLSATGIDGVANTATRLASTAINAKCSHTHSVGGTPYVFSVWLRRVSGTGAIKISADNFATTSTVTLTSAWQRFEISSSSGAGVVGIQIDTSGDVIEFDYAQCELGSVATSPILTTSSTVTRNADSIANTGMSALNAATGALVMTGQLLRRPTAQTSAATLAFTTPSASVSFESSGNLTAIYSNSGTQCSISTGGLANGAAYGCAFSWAANDYRFAVNGSQGTADTSGTVGSTAGSQLTLGAGSQLGHIVKSVKLYAAAKANADLNALASATDSEHVAAYDSGWVDAWPADWVSGTTAEERSGVRGVAILNPASAQTHQYWRFDLTDTANTAGYVQLGRVFMGTNWEPDRGAATGATLGYESRSTTTEADDGAEYHTERRGPRVVRFNIEAQTQDEAMRKVLEMQRQLGSTGEVLFQWDTSDTLYQPARTFLGRLRSLSPLTAINSNLWSASFEIKELL